MGPNVLKAKWQVELREFLLDLVVKISSSSGYHIHYPVITGRGMDCRSTIALFQLFMCLVVVGLCGGGSHQRR